MKTDVILAGFGGQGMLLIGKLLSLAAMEEGKEVCWLPSYGPEMRGGTANVTVTIAEQPIGSPVVSKPEAAAVMNQPSLEKFAPALVPGGLLIVNESLVKVRAERDDIRVMYLPANDLANGIGAKRSPNIVVLGAYVALAGVVAHESVHEQIRHQFSRKPQIAEINLQAYQLGVDAAAEFAAQRRPKAEATKKAKTKATKKTKAQAPAQAAKKTKAQAKAAKRTKAQAKAAKKAKTKAPAQAAKKAKGQARADRRARAAAEPKAAKAPTKRATKRTAKRG